MGHRCRFGHTAVDCAFDRIQLIQMLFVVVMTLENLAEIVRVTVFTPNDGIHA